MKEYLYNKKIHVIIENTTESFIRYFFINSNEILKSIYNQKENKKSDFLFETFLGNETEVELTNNEAKIFFDIMFEKFKKDSIVIEEKIREELFDMINSFLMNYSFIMGIKIPDLIDVETGEIDFSENSKRERENILELVNEFYESLKKSEYQNFLKLENSVRNFNYDTVGAYVYDTYPGYSDLKQKIVKFKNEPFDNEFPAFLLSNIFGDSENNLKLTQKIMGIEQSISFYNNIFLNYFDFSEDIEQIFLDEKHNYISDLIEASLTK